MESHFKYDLEASLPTEGVTSAILVTVEIEPKDAGCLIYGKLANGNMGCVEVRGARSEIELPFTEPKIYVKYMMDLKHIRILTRGWKKPHR